MPSPDGWPLLPICLGSNGLIAGVKATQSGEQPRLATTALPGPDGSCRLGTKHDPVDRVDQAADLIHE